MSSTPHLFSPLVPTLPKYLKVPSPKPSTNTRLPTLLRYLASFLTLVIVPGAKDVLPERIKRYQIRAHDFKATLASNTSPSIPPKFSFAQTRRLRSTAVVARVREANVSTGTSNVTC
eukprot:m.42181 g.42181  ORF g.42181 m.42181 type:complete len:117 (+) comp19026_c0_seq1:397-747(+)